MSWIVNELTSSPAISLPSHGPTLSLALHFTNFGYAPTKPLKGVSLVQVELHTLCTAITHKMESCSSLYGTSLQLICNGLTS